MNKYEFIIFDFETNGTHPDKESALSLSALRLKIKSDKTLDTVDKYDRYYYPEEGEEYNSIAIGINGLSDEEVDIRRAKVDAHYAPEFLDDIESFKKFSSSCDHFMGHNVIDFDIKWFRNKMEFPYVFDTMKENFSIVEACREDGQAKNPKLEEASYFYGFNAEEGPQHESLWDCICTAKIFQAMLLNSTLRLDSTKIGV
jgi:DNA polymerase-3 subunit epsilon